MLTARKFERDIDLLLAEEFAVNEGFGNWFLRRTKKFAEQSAKFEHVYVSKTDFVGESDLVVVFRKIDGGACFGLLIEDKIDAPLQPEQAGRYRIRGKRDCAAGIYSEFEVILCAPQVYIDGHEEIATTFDGLVSYEEIATFLKTSGVEDIRGLYRANFIEHSIPQSGNTWSRVDDTATNSFWDAAYQLASLEFPDLEMKPLTVTKDSTWINFHTIDMPPGPWRTYLSFKGDRGYMDLTFSGVRADNFREHLGSLLTTEKTMIVHQTGKSAAIRIEVDGFKIAEPQDIASAKLRRCFEECVRLIRFYRLNKTVLEAAALKSRPENWSV